MHESQLVDWVARENIAQGKGVICVHSGDKPPVELLEFVGELGLKVVPWKHDALSAGIEQAAPKTT